MDPAGRRRCRLNVSRPGSRGGGAARAAVHGGVTTLGVARGRSVAAQHRLPKPDVCFQTSPLNPRKRVCEPSRSVDISVHLQGRHVAAAAPLWFSHFLDFPRFVRNPLMCHPVECVEFCGCASCFPLLGAPPLLFIFTSAWYQSTPGGAESPPDHNPESFWPLGRNLEVFISSFIITYGRRFINCCFFFLLDQIPTCLTRKCQSCLNLNKTIQECCCGFLWTESSILGREEAIKLSLASRDSSFSPHGINESNVRIGS